MPVAPGDGGLFSMGSAPAAAALLTLPLASLLFTFFHP